MKCILKARHADVTGGCWPLLTTMLLSWLSTICVLFLLAAVLRVNVYGFCVHVYEIERSAHPWFTAAAGRL